MDNEKQIKSVKQIQANITDLVDEIRRLPEGKREEMLAALENIQATLHDLPAETPPASTEMHEHAPPVLPAEEDFAALRASLPTVYYTWDIETDRMQLSKGLEQITGSSTVPGAYLREWIHSILPEDHQRMEPKLARLRLERKYPQPDQKPTQSYEFEYRLLRADNSMARIWDRAIILFDAEGCPLRAVGMLEDITALTSLQRSLLLSYKALAESNIALRKQEKQVRSALLNVPVAFFQTDQDLRYTWIYSPIAYNATEQYIGKRDDEILPGETTSEIIQMKQEALKSRSRMQQEIIIPFKGKNRQIFVSVQPICDDQKNITGLVGAYVDMTEQHSLENTAYERAFKLELNRRLLEQHEQEHRQIGRFIQEGPIQDLSALGFALQLARQLFPQPESLNVLEQLRDEVKNLVIELRQVSNELRPPGLSHFGLTRALQSYTEDFQNRNPDINIRMTLSDNGAGLPDSTLEALFRIINESFLNILNHAQASEVMVNLDIKPEMIHMEIKDNGRGFVGEPDWLQLTSQGHYGLLRMKESAEAIGGTLRIQSAPEQGTLVVTEVPLAR